MANKLFKSPPLNVSTLNSPHVFQQEGEGEEGDADYNPTHNNEGEF